MLVGINFFLIRYYNLRVVRGCAPSSVDSWHGSAVGYCEHDNEVWDH